MGTTPLTSPWFALAVLVGYLVAVYGLQALLRKRDAVHPMGLIRAHNLLLSLVSLVLAVAMGAIVSARVGKHGLHWAVCAREMHEGDWLQFLYWINYLVKMWEFLDTIFLVVRKKRVIFLHSYHHAATFLLTYVQQINFSTVQWIPILLNLIVHVVMYWYYYLQACGVKRIWWKRYVTVLQIVQFVLDLVACVYAYSSILFTYCHGTHFGAISGISILASYLVLFL
eukprot:CAMPEP_0196772960 /NCGR_PEP_ID=MMETSP1104-20130614/2512_1 /TAXON_ID=33652 /ORGANISM="Cafeteria sp., Strain Caron Lab Isolate" /LENGTH=225 /DNA_ID=CAMNT_0042143103 /DNA_START=1 /DNA_END=674 /DNA_ORIENTATION=-